MDMIITGAAAYSWAPPGAADLPDDVLQEVADYALAAVGCGLSLDDVEADLLGRWSALVEDVSAEVVGTELHVVAVPRLVAA